MWLAEYDIDVYNAPEVFSVPPLTRLILPVMSGRTSVVEFPERWGRIPMELLRES